MTTSKTTKKKIDWEAVERDYRIGQLSVREVAEKHEVSVSGLMKRAKKEGWTRDLSKAVQVATKAKVRQAVVKEWNRSGTEVEHSTFSEVDLAANVNATIILRHQSRAVRLGNLLENMLGELEEVSANPIALEQLVLAVGQNDPLAADGINQLRSVHKRMDTLKVAAEINVKVQDAERKACNIGDDGDSKGAGVEEALANILKDSGRS